MHAAEGQPGGVMTTNERSVGRYLRWLLAALSLGAGVIHFAVAGEHYEVTWAHGTFFAVVAWLQLSWAVAVVLRPNRSVLTAGVLLNAAILGVWAGSRIWGVPIGPDASTPEATRVPARGLRLAGRVAVGVRARHRRARAGRTRPSRVGAASGPARARRSRRRHRRPRRGGDLVPGVHSRTRVVPPAR